MPPPGASILAFLGMINHISWMSKKFNFKYEGPLSSLQLEPSGYKMPLNNAELDKYSNGLNLFFNREPPIVKS